MNTTKHMVWVADNLPSITKFIDSYGHDAFVVAAFYGAWNEGLYHYVHPYQGLSDTLYFSLIQQAAIAAFV